MQALSKLKKNMTALLSQPDLPAPHTPNSKPISNFQMLYAEDCESLIREKLSKVGRAHEDRR